MTKGPPSRARVGQREAMVSGSVPVAGGGQGLLFLRSDPPERKAGPCRSALSTHVSGCLNRSLADASMCHRGLGIMHLPEGRAGGSRQAVTWSAGVPAWSIPRPCGSGHKCDLRNKVELGDGVEVTM